MTERPEPSPADHASPPPPGVRRRSRRLTLAGLATSALGLALLVYLVRRTGVAPILEGAREVGWGFLGIVALGGLRFVTRAVAWGRCVETPWRLTFRQAFAATLSGDALGNVTPLSVIVSEPAKVAFVGPAVPLGPAASALAIENFLYTLSVAVMIALGLIAMLLAFDLTESLRTISAVSLAAVVGLLLAAIWMIGRRLAVVSPILDRLAGGRASRWIAKVRLLEARTFELYERRRGRLVPVLALEAAFHAAGVAEVYLTLWLLAGVAPTLLIAFLLESVNRVITVVFKFVPLRVGVDEAGTALVTNVLGLGTATGVTLALVRKARVVVWVLVGLALLVRRGITVKGILADAESQ
jgi:hypothetical protein